MKSWLIPAGERSWWEAATDTLAVGCRPRQTHSDPFTFAHPHSGTQSGNYAPHRVTPLLLVVPGKDLMPVRRETLLPALTDLETVPSLPRHSNGEGKRGGGQGQKGGASAWCVPGYGLGFLLRVYTPFK